MTTGEAQGSEALIVKWRNEGAAKDRFHATMGIGWKVCADELESALAAALPVRQEDTKEPLLDCEANVFQQTSDSIGVSNHELDEAVAEYRLSLADGGRIRREIAFRRARIELLVALGRLDGRECEVPWRTS